MRFLIHGSIAYDYLLHSDSSFVDGLKGQDLEKLSVGFFAHRMARHHGGTATNISWNMLILGQKPMVVGTVGRDGKECIELLAGQGIDVSMIEMKRDYLTASAFIATDSNERQITFFHPGADAHGTLPAPELLKNIDCAIISPRDHVLMQQAAAQCQALSIPYIFDPGQQSLAFSRDELRRVVTGARCLVMNAYEWQITRDKLEWDAPDILRVCELIVVTQGDQGVTIHSREETLQVPACSPKLFMNPTGAGDAMRAALLVGLVSEWSLRDTARLGAAMASFVIEQEGTLLETVTLADIRARAKATYGEELPVI
ncbi:MAG: hypothetical protein KBD00_03205 [Candidatus Peribacteraceae bacterium]|nr:hypothetical protein [Candidatus Peribacteraceae bacterium]